MYKQLLIQIGEVFNRNGFHGPATILLEEVKRRATEDQSETILHGIATVLQRPSFAAGASAPVPETASPEAPPTPPAPVADESVPESADDKTPEPPVPAA